MDDGAFTEPPLGNCASLFRSYHGRVSAITFESSLFRFHVQLYSARRVYGREDSAACDLSTWR